MAVELKASLGKLTGNSEQDIKVMYNYVMQLTEELRYAMNNIGISNLNDKELARYENGRLQVFSKVVDLRVKEFEVLAEETEKEIRAQIKVNSDSITQIVSSIGKNGEVTAASIVLAINEDSGESGVKIKADKIELEGVVTISDLENGETVVDGSCIKTGEIRAVNFVARGDGNGGIGNSFVVEDSLGDEIGRIGYQFDSESSYGYEDKIWIRTESRIIGTREYNPAIKMEAAGGVSIRSGGQGIYIYDGSKVEWMFKDGYLHKNGVVVL